MKKAITLTATLLLATGCADNNNQTDATPMTSEQTFIEWSQQRAAPIASLEAGSGNSGLMAIKRAVGDAKVVVLNEGFHNCSEMMQLHHRVIRYLQATDYLDRVDPDYSSVLKPALSHTLEIMGDDARKQHQNVLTPQQRSDLTLALELLGDQIYVIGMTCGGGEFWNNWQRPPERTIAPIQDHHTDGMESTFKAVGQSQFFVDFHSAPTAAQEWLNTETTIRENDYYINLHPSEWDGCFYLDKASPATPAE